VTVRAVLLLNANLPVPVESDDLGDGAGRPLEDRTPMKLSLSSRYAVRAVVAIAAHKGPELVIAQEVTAEHGLPAQFVSKLLRLLVKAGLLQSLRGPNGGFSLTKPAGAVTLLEIVEAVDGPVRGEVPPSGGAGACSPRPPAATGCRLGGGDGPQAPAGNHGRRVDGHSGKAIGFEVLT
jgi:Rrf2 family protein